MEEDEFSLFIMYLLQHIKHILEKKDKSTQVLFEVQSHCYALMSLLDGGQRREVVGRVQIDSLLLFTSFSRNSSRSEGEETPMKYCFWTSLPLSGREKERFFWRGID
jgi:hypothetical protein